jgi:hypothetical protein
MLDELLATAAVAPVPAPVPSGDASSTSKCRLSSSTPEDGVKAAVTVTFEGLRLEQEGGAAVALRAEKRKPVMEMSLKAVEFRAGATTKDNVKAVLADT